MPGPLCLVGDVEILVLLEGALRLPLVPTLPAAKAVEILVLLEGALRPYPFFAPLASGPRHLPPIPAEIPRTTSSHHIYSRSIVIKISPIHRISPHEGFSDSPTPSES